eukprot:6149563-Pyramimonas_sp.AAC.1
MNLERLPCVNGGRSGAAVCQTQGTFAIARACQRPDKPPTTRVDAFVGIIVDESGSDSPATHGLRENSCDLGGG